MLVSWPEIEPRPSAVKTRSPNHWTTREFPCARCLTVMCRHHSVCLCCICVLLHPMPYFASFPVSPMFRAHKDQGDSSVTRSALTREQPACILEGRCVSDLDLLIFSKDTFSHSTVDTKTCPQGLSLLYLKARLS